MAWLLGHWSGLVEAYECAGFLWLSQPHTSSEGLVKTGVVGGGGMGLLLFDFQLLAFFPLCMGQRMLVA